MTDWEKYSKEELDQKIESLEAVNEDLREYIRRYLVGDRDISFVRKLLALVRTKKGD